MDWTRAVFLGMDWLWFLLGLLCLAAAAGLSSRRLGWEDLNERLERLPAPLILGTALPAALALFKIAQFRAFLLFNDSANLPNVVWELSHGHGFTASLYAGRSFLSQHIAFSLVFLAPIVRLWESTASLAAAHGAALGAAVYGFFLLCRKLTGSALAAWLGALLMASHPLFSSMAVFVLELRIFAPALFVCAAYCLETGRTRAAAVLGMILLGVGEQVPLLAFGLGLLAFARARTPSRRWAAAGLLAGSAALFAGELALIDRAKEGAAWLHDQWGLFAPLGGSPAGLVRAAFERPWLFALALVAPPIKVWTAARALASAGLFPAVSGSFFLPAAAVWVPQQLAVPASSFHKLVGPEAGVLFGPLLWSAAHGFSRFWARAGSRGRSLLAAWILAVSACGFVSSAGFSPPAGAMPSAWREAVPRAAENIPKDAKLWCDEYLTPHFAMREHIRFLPRGPDAYFETGLFVPDRVLLSAHWLARADPAVVRRILGFLDRRGFVRVFAEADLVVLAAPGTLSGAPGPLEAARL